MMTLTTDQNAETVLLSIVVEVLFEVQVEPSFTRPLSGNTFFSADGSVDEMMTYGMLKD
jgi:hypothetical protein